MGPVGIRSGLEVPQKLMIGLPTHPRCRYARQLVLAKANKNVPVVTPKPKWHGDSGIIVPVTHAQVGFIYFLGPLHPSHTHQSMICTSLVSDP